MSKEQQGLLSRFFNSKSAALQPAPEMVALQAEIEGLKARLEDATIDDHVRAYGAVKGVDEFGVNSGNSLNYHTAIDQDLDLGTLQRLLVTEGWFYIVVWTIAKTIAALPVKVQKRTIREEPVDPQNPAAGTTKVETWVDATGEPEQLMFEYPNDLQPAIEFYWLVLMDLLSTGNTFLYLDVGYEAIEVKTRTKALKARYGEKRNKFGKLVPATASQMKVQGIYRMNPSMVQPCAKPNSGMLDGYAYNAPDGIFKFGLHEVVHAKLPNPVDPFLGLAPIVPVYKNVLLDRYSTEHMIRFYKQGARLGGVVKTTQKLSKDQLTRLQRSFDQDYTGRANHHKTLILPQGMEYQTIEQNPGETSLIEFSKSNREPITSAYNVPPIKIGLLDGATFANALVQEKIFFTDTIIPILTILEQSLNKHETLMPTQRGLRVKFDLSQVEALQEYQSEKADTAKKLLDAGWTPNEVRQAIFKKPPLKGGDKAPVIEKLDSGGFPIFGLGAPRGLEKDGDDPEAGGESLQAIMAQFSGPQITSIMNVIRRAEKGQLKAEAALEMLTTMFGIPEKHARTMLGMAQPEQKDDLPTQQPDAALIASDVTPTRVTYEERVRQLVAQAVADGVPLDQALAHAMERARQEGFEPSVKPESVQTAPQSAENNQTADEQKEEGEGVVTAPEFTPTLVGNKPKDEDEENEDGDDKSASDFGAGGTHVHKYPASAQQTLVDGKHKHCFVLPDGTEILTGEDGEHAHPIPAQGDQSPSGAHKHPVTINGEQVFTEEDGGHGHTYGAAETNLSGDHIHVLKLKDGTTINSLTASDYQSRQLKKPISDKAPITKEQAIAHFSKMSGDGVKHLVEKREKSVAEFFKRLERLINDGWSKKLRKHGIHMKFSTKAGDSIIDKNKKKKFIEEEAAKAAPDFEESMKYGYENNLVEYNLVFPNERAAKVAERIAGDMITKVTDTTIDQINDIISSKMEENATVQEVSTAIRDYFDGEEGMTAARVQTITRTETLMAVSVGQDEKNQEFKKEYPEMAGKLRKIWITSQDERVRGNPDGLYPNSEANHHEMEGEVVDEDEEFSNNLKYPRDPAGDASEVINCRCSWMTFHKDDEEDIVANTQDTESPLSDVDAGPEKSAPPLQVKWALPPRKWKGATQS